MNKLKLIRGDDTTITVALKQNGIALDITDYTIFFTLKKNLNDSDEDSVIQKTITDHVSPEEGQTSIILTSNDTNIKPGGYFWDLQMKDPNGLISSTQYGTAEILQDVTRRTT